MGGAPGAATSCAFFCSVFVRRSPALLEQAEAETRTEAAQQLEEAKASWDNFRTLFCRSMSTTYGGMWASVHESECRAKLAEDFRGIMGGYGW
jgi:hypothetical protein